MAALASVADLEARMMVQFDDVQTTAVSATLDDISALARLYGLPTWGNPVPVPDAVKAVVLAVAERRMRNPEGYVSEMAGEYSYRLPEAGSAGVGFKDDELHIIRLCSGRSGLAAVPVNRPVRVAHRRYWPYGKNPEHGDL